LCGGGRAAVEQTALGCAVVGGGWWVVGSGWWIVGGGFEGDASHGLAGSL